MALDVPGRLGFVNCNICSFTGDFSTSTSAASNVDCAQRSRPSWVSFSKARVCFRSKAAYCPAPKSPSAYNPKLTTCCSLESQSKAFGDVSLGVKRVQLDVASRRRRIRICTNSSASNSNGSQLHGSWLGDRSSLLGGWIDGDLSGQWRNSLFAGTRKCGNSSSVCQYSPHQIVCDAQGKKPLGSFLGSRIVEEPWTWLLDGFVFRARRKDGGSLDGESRGLLGDRRGGATAIPRLNILDSSQTQPLTSARPRRGTIRDESLPRRILRNCIPQSHNSPPKRDTGIASEKDWGINLKDELTSESGINEDGSTWYRESGEDLGDNGYRCRWTVMGGKSGDELSEWKEAWWEKSDWTGYKELGAEKSGKNALGDSWWETWQEVLRQDDWSNLARIEKSAQKQAKSGSGSAGWYEKWWEKYNAKGWAEKGAHKYGRLNDQGWWEKWGEQYDGRGAVLKWTDKWAETDMGTKWGDKWEEKFSQGIGTRQGETWHYSANGERWSRTWGEEHVGTGKVHKYGKSTSGESWDSVVEEGTFYQAEPHYGWGDAVGNSIQLLAIEALERPPGIYPDLDLGMPPLPPPPSPPPPQ